MEGRIGLDGDIFKGSQSYTIQFCSKGELTADIHKPAAAFVGHPRVSFACDRSGGEIEFQYGTVQRGLKMFHGKGLSALIQITVSDGCKVNCFFLVRVHFFFAMYRDELPVGGIPIGLGTVKCPGYLVCTGFFYLGSLFFRKRKGQRFACAFCQRQKEFVIAVRLNNRLLFHFCTGFNAGVGGAATGNQREYEKYG